MIVRMLLIAILLLTGCTSYTHNFPQPISAVCSAALNASQSRLKIAGTSVEPKSSCTVRLHRAEKNIQGQWCWYVPQCNGYVNGTCSGSCIEIGCNPKNNADIRIESLIHEMAHYWLITNFGNWKHDAKYDNYFENWKLSRDTQLRLCTVSIRDSTGLVTYYDAVKFGK